MTKSLLFQRRWQAKPDGGFNPAKGNPQSASLTAPLEKEPIYLQGTPRVRPLLLIPPPSDIIIKYVHRTQFGGREPCIKKSRRV